MERVFVTGGSGFLGGRLIPRLVARQIDVRALARSEASALAVEALGATAVMGDLGNEQALRAGAEGCDTVFHLAAKVETWGPWSEFLDITVEGTRRVCEAARHARVGRLVHVSTEAVLVGGGPIVDATEDRPLPDAPIGAYPRSKGMAEEIVRAAADDTLATVIVRPRLIWGAGDTTLLPEMVEAAREGRWRWIAGGRYRTSTCHVDNVAHGCMLAGLRGASGACYFLTDGDPVEFRGFIERYLGTQGVELGDASIPRWMARAAAAATEATWRLLRKSGAPPIDRTIVRLMGEEVTVDASRARRELGYKPIVTIADGLAAMRDAPEGATAEVA